MSTCARSENSGHISTMFVIVNFHLTTSSISSSNTPLWHLHGKVAEPQPVPQFTDIAFKHELMKSVVAGNLPLWTVEHLQFHRLLNMLKPSLEMHAPTSRKNILCLSHVRRLGRHLYVLPLADASLRSSVSPSCCLHPSTSRRLIPNTCPWTPTVRNRSLTAHFSAPATQRLTLRPLPLRDTCDPLPRRASLLLCPLHETRQGLCLEFYVAILVLSVSVPSSMSLPTFVSYSWLTSIVAALLALLATGLHSQFLFASLSICSVLCFLSHYSLLQLASPYTELDPHSHLPATQHPPSTVLLSPYATITPTPLSYV